ncbi:MAG: class I tRNA ligase family protein, partial [Lautropia mirabilis]|nr:class I tRNA ligase family protein [Lautropia mirabilis]
MIRHRTGRAAALAKIGSSTPGMPGPLDGASCPPHAGILSTLSCVFMSQPQPSAASAAAAMPAATGPHPERLFITTALPYANGSFHIGHIMEYIQA